MPCCSSTPPALRVWYREALVRLHPDDPEAAVTQVLLSRALSLDGHHVEAGKVAMAAVARLPIGEARSAGLVDRGPRLPRHRRSPPRRPTARPVRRRHVRRADHAVLRAVVDAFDASPTDAIRMTRSAVADGAPGQDPTVLATLAEARAGAGDFEAAAALTRQLRTSSATRSSDDRLRAALHACVLSAVEFDPRDALSDVGEPGPGAPMAGWFLSAAVVGAPAVGAPRRCHRHRRGGARLRRPVGRRPAARDHRACRGHRPPRTERDRRGRGRSWSGPPRCRSSRPEPGSASPPPACTRRAPSSTERIEIVREAVGIEAARGRRNVLGALYAELVELAFDADDETTARAANDRLQALPRSRSATAMNMRCLLSDAMCGRTSDLAVAAYHYASPPRARAGRRSGPRPRRRDPRRRRHPHVGARCARPPRRGVEAAPSGGPTPRHRPARRARP